MTDRRRAAGPWWAVVVPVVLAAAVYQPIRHVWFYADDLMHLAEIESEPVATFLLRPFGGHNYLVRNAIFLASYEVFGLRASFYYWTVLLTHLVNVALMSGVVRRLTGSAWLALLAAAAWGTSPLAVGTLGWYSVYGQVLVATALLVALRAALVHGDGSLPASTTVGCCLVLLAATTCFGIGVGLTLVFPAALFLLAPGAWRRTRVRAMWLALPLVTLALYVGFRRLYAYLAPMTEAERFQEAVVFAGVGFVPAMLAQLVGFGVSGSLLGPFGPAVYPTAASAAALAAVAVALGVALWRGDAATRRALLGMLLLVVGGYAVVALGRAQLYAAFAMPATKAAAVPRYHYAVSIPIVAVLALLAREIGRLGPLRGVSRPAVVAVALALGACGWMLRGSPVTNLHTDCRDWFVQTAQGIGALAHAAPPNGPVYVENLETPRNVLGPSLPPETFPGRAAVFLLAQRGDTLDGRPVRFIERNAQVLAYYRARPRNRLGKLLVAADEVDGTR